MSRNSIYVRVLLVVMVLAILVAFLGRDSKSAPADSWLPSTFNPIGGGLRAFYQTLSDLHWPVERWREPISRLSSKGTGNELIVTRSAVDWRLAYTADEAELLASWVKAGNTLVLLGPLAKWDDTRALLAQFGLTTLPHETPVRFFDRFRFEPEKEIEASPSGDNQGRLILPQTDQPPIHLPADARVLWATGSAPTITDVPFGTGRVIWVSSAGMLSNHYLMKGDDLAIALRLLAPHGVVPRHVYFEERHHGYAPAFAVGRLVKHPGVRLAGLLALLGIVTFFGSAFVRFGPILPLEREPGRSSLEFVDSIAELYHRSDLRNDMMRFLFDDTHRHLRARLNLPNGASHAVIADRLAQIHPGLPGWKKLAQRFDSQDYVAGLPPGGWLRIARELIQIKNAIA